MIQKQKSDELAMRELLQKDRMMNMMHRRLDASDDKKNLQSIIDSRAEGQMISKLENLYQIKKTTRQNYEELDFEKQFQRNHNFILRQHNIYNTKKLKLDTLKERQRQVYLIKYSQKLTDKVPLAPTRQSTPIQIEHKDSRTSYHECISKMPRDAATRQLDSSSEALPKPTPHTLSQRYKDKRSNSYLGSHNLHQEGVFR